MEYEEFQRRCRVSKVTWCLQGSAHGDQFVIYNEAEDFVRLMSEFAASTHSFDVWFRQKLTEITGIDFTRFESSQLPEQLLKFGY
jgi:hypothetical protein